MVRTRTIDNNLNPEWDQDFHLLVDDPDSQSLSASPWLLSLCLKTR